MADWQPLDDVFPDSFEESYDVSFLDADWNFRRIGDDAWLASDELDVVLPLPRLRKFSGLFAEPEFAAEGTRRLAAAAPMLYLAIGNEPLGIEDITTGTYDITWYDLDARRWCECGERDLDGGDETFVAPDDVTGAVGLYLRRTSR